MARKDTTTTTKPAKAPTQPAAKTAKPAGKAPGAKASVKAAPPPARGGAKAAPARAKAAPPPPKPVTVTLKHLAAGLSERRGLPKRDAEALAAELVGDLVAQIKTGAKVRIAGLGVLEIRNRPARTARNPATGEPVQVAASRKLVFRAAKELKAAV
jgi:DNA-binding protein HU-beta